MENQYSINIEFIPKGTWVYMSLTYRPFWHLDGEWQLDNINATGYIPLIYLDTKPE